ncbi:MFS transporter [Pseudomonas sp. SWRI74]|uniref:MFS transporter n=1 Tax=Pseudomonas azerbaijanoccidentalis TaxID=2842347 RepID=A0ABS6QHQ0_9PSED|nr:MFS transporter [Pseudomonas azerbaijanoccidentalis]
MRTAMALGLSQLINWGVSFYLLGAFGPAMVKDLGWSGQQVFAGLSVAMVVMGLVSPFTGGLVERCGGRAVLRFGTLLNAVSCMLLASSWPSLPIYYLIWMLFGVGMRLSLYDALFAVLAGLAGERARGTMVRITLLGGLSSTVFWPLGSGLQDLIGWRHGLMVYAALCLVSVTLLYVLPAGAAMLKAELGDSHATPQRAASVFNQWLFGLGVTLVGVLSAGLAPQLPDLLTSLGAPIGLVALWGIGQTCARMTQSLLGESITALSLNVWVGISLPLCFAIGLLSQGRVLLAGLFVFGYGALNGLSTLLRASLPFELFAPDQYARLTGKLVAPAFILSAFAPWLFAAVRDHSGDRTLLWMALGIGLCSLMVAIALKAVGGIDHGPTTKE